jgi:probable lipoprotein NlpC
MRGIRGVQFIYDNKGNKTSAVVDLRRYNDEFALFLEKLSHKKSSEDSSVADNLNKFTNNGSAINNRKTKVDSLIKKSRSLYGVPYRTGGVTVSGMDCSGFTQVCFKSVGVNLPRVSRDQSFAGNPVELPELKPGDLVFFATATANRINHVGIISDVTDSNDIKFIHASSSRGVMQTSMSIDYWVKAFVKAKRIL